MGSSRERGRVKGAIGFTEDRLYAGNDARVERGNEASQRDGLRVVKIHKHTMSRESGTGSP